MLNNLFILCKICIEKQSACERCQVILLNIAKEDLLRLDKPRHHLSVHLFRKGRQKRRQKPIFKLSAWFVLFDYKLSMWEGCGNRQQNQNVTFSSRSKFPFLMVWELYWVITMEPLLSFLGLSVSILKYCF